MSAPDFDQLDPVQDDAPQESGLPPTSYPNLLSFLLALLGPWGIATAVGALALVLLSFGLDAAWQASPRLPEEPAKDVAQPPIKGAVGWDTVPPSSQIPQLLPPEPGGETAK